VVKIVRDELAALLGEEGRSCALTRRPSVVLLCGLQGSGKTTTAGKLARRIAARGRHPVLVAGDLQRAAAVEQLVQVGPRRRRAGDQPEEGEDVLRSPSARLEAGAASEARRDDLRHRRPPPRRPALMAELQALAERVSPVETLFVADAMTGQDAVKSAEEFAAALPLTGVILTKLDGDSRGGAALSIRTVARVPIRFVGVGEKAEDLELFHPERMASRMIGMGDVLSLIERAERQLDSGETERLARRMANRTSSRSRTCATSSARCASSARCRRLLEMMPQVGPFKGLAGAQVDEGSSGASRRSSTR
jgi:signal recognition particle subunit SRP54